MHTLMHSKNKKKMKVSGTRPLHITSTRCLCCVRQPWVSDRHAGSSKTRLLSPCLLFALMDPDGVASQRSSTKKKHRLKHRQAVWHPIYAGYKRLSCIY